MDTAGPRRLGAALHQALARRSVRESCELLPDLDLVVAASTVRAMLTRHSKEPLDHMVIDVGVPDADTGIQEAIALGLAATLLVISDNPARTAQDYGLRSHQVIPRIENAAGEQILARLGVTTVGKGTPNPTPRKPTESSKFKRREIVVIGCSTGGPDALPVVLAALPEDFSVPIVIVQHMPPNFTALLAQRLDVVCPLTVREVTEPVKVKRGEVWIAPGHRHVVFADSSGSLEFDDGPEVKNCRPSVDVLFHSAARAYGRRVVSVILTGMGDDGCDGARSLDAQDAFIIAQDERTSVVWGMPGAVTRAGLADAVVPLTEVADLVVQQFRVPDRVGSK